MPFAALLFVAALPSGLHLEWLAPEGSCPDRAFLEGRIAQLAGPTTKDVEITMRTIVDAPGASAGWQARLWIKSATGEQTRVLEGETCRGLAEAIAVIASMMLSEGRVPEAKDVARPDPPVPPRPTPLSARPTEPPIVPAAIPPEARPTTEPAPGTIEASALPTSDEAAIDLAWALRLDVFGDFGSLPQVGPGLAASVALMVDASLSPRLELGGGMSWPQRRVIRSDPEAGGDFLRFVFQGRGCVAPATGEAWSLSLCTGVELGVVRAVGFGVTRPGVAIEPIPGILAEVRFSVAISRLLSLVGQLQTAWLLARPIFTLDPIGEVDQASPVAIRAALGLEVGAF